MVAAGLFLFALYIQECYLCI